MTAPFREPPDLGEFLPRSVLRDPEAMARLKRRAHRMRSEAVRDAIGGLLRKILQWARAQSRS